MSLRKKKGIVFVPLLAVGFILFVSLASAGNVTRSFSSSSVSAGTQVNVSLIVDIDEGNPNESYYYIQEEVPAGWTILDNASALEVDGRNITWAYGPSPADTTLAYVVQAPSSSGSYSFYGSYAIGSPIVFSVLGGDTVSVASNGIIDSGNPGGGGGGGTPKFQCNDKLDNDKDGLIDYPNDPQCNSTADNSEFSFEQPVGPSGCEEQWTCADWGACNEENVKVRTCTEENACGTEIFKPQTEGLCESPTMLLVGGVRLDIIFAVVVIVLSLATAIIGLTFWIKGRDARNEMLEKRKALMNAVRENVV